MADLGTDVAGIGAYLSTRRLVIPEYQRSYSWGPEGERNEVQDLWDDLSRAIAERQADYFLGAVVTIRGGTNGRIEVIDGQQRLATVSLLYAAMRDLFASRSDERAKEIEAKVLGEKSFGDRALSQFLTLNADDNDYFRQLTLVAPSDRTAAASLGSHRRLKYAYDFFVQRLDELAGQSPGPDWAKPIVAWYEYVWRNVLVLEISVPNESRGFVIFETLNDRGLNLSTADLLKNHLFGRAEGRLDEVKTRWARAVAPFDDPDRNLDVDTFLRHFWASRNGVVRVKGLFTLMKPDVQTPEQAVSFAEALQQSSRAWTAMFDVASDYWTGYARSSLTALETLRNLNVEQCRPLLLAALQKLPRPDVELLLALVVDWSVRWLVVGGGGAGTTRAALRRNGPGCDQRHDHRRRRDCRPIQWRGSIGSGIPAGVRSTQHSTRLVGAILAASARAGIHRDSRAGTRAQRRCPRGQPGARPSQISGR